MTAPAVSPADRITPPGTPRGMPEFDQDTWNSVGVLQNKLIHIMLQEEGSSGHQR